MSNRKKEFRALLQILSDIFCETTNVQVAKNCCLSLGFLAEADQARRDDALRSLKNTAATLRTNLTKWIKEEANEKTKHTLQRLSMLAQRCSLHSLLEDIDNDTLPEISMELYAYAENQLKLRKLEIEDDEARELCVPPSWDSLDCDCHVNVAQSICFIFDTFMALMSWELKNAVDMIDRGDEPEFSDNELSDHMAIRFRSQAMNLVVNCFDLSPPNEGYEAWQYTDIQAKFLSVVRHRAFQAFSDTCTLFPAAWAKAKSPFLKACAWDPRESMAKSGASNFVWVKLKMVRYRYADTFSMLPETHSSIITG